jgi:hypothetical protein
MESSGTIGHEEEHPEPRVPAAPGLNRFVWNLRYPDAVRLPGEKSFESAPGPVALPGRYRVDLVIGDRSWTESFEILPDPRGTATAEALRQQFQLALRIRDTLSALHAAVIKLRDVIRQIDAWTVVLKRQPDTSAIVDKSVVVKQALTQIEGALVQRESNSPLNPPSRLNFKLAALLEAVQLADAAPTLGQIRVFHDLEEQVELHLNALNQVLLGELSELNREMSSAPIQPIAPLD